MPEFHAGVYREIIPYIEGGNRQHISARGTDNCNDSILIQRFGMVAVAGIIIRDALKVFIRKKKK